jgi:hypothetical protein
MPKAEVVNVEVVKVEVIIPVGSLLDGSALNIVDPYIADAMGTSVADGTTVDEMAELFFSRTPKPVMLAMRVRNAIVGRLGFGTSSDSDAEPLGDGPATFEVGSKLSVFEVLDRDDDEILFGHDDRHISFRMSLRVDSAEQLVVAATVGKGNSFLGRAYLVVVRPFHKLVVPAMLRSMVKPD